MSEGVRAMSAEPRSETAASGLVFNIQKYSLHDGPGIRSTVFLKGCPLSCAWCHNPESISPAREFIVAENRCITCGECRSVCPFAETSPGSGPLPARNDDCDFCGECSEACPTGARQLVGERMTVAAVLDAALRDRIFYEESGGGVTISGGEPLLQWQFVSELLDALRAEGIHTALDTSGYGPLEQLISTATRADLVLYDLKVFDNARHLDFTGVSNEGILANLQELDRVHDAIWIRVPIVPGFTDDPEDLARIAGFVLGLKHVTRVSLLPFHRAAERKYERLDRLNRTALVDVPSAVQMARAADIFRNLLLPVHVGA